MLRRLFAPAALAVAFTLVGVAGCADSTGPAPTGEVTGRVTVDGTGLPDLVVELSGGGRRQDVTDEQGVFAFDDVPAGAYVVTLLDVPGDAAFPATSKTAVIAREPGRQNERVDFSGNYIRTSTITGTVTARGRPVPLVSVRVEGPDTVALASDAEGRFVAGGLRSGRYDVSISGFPDLVTFPSTQVQVDVGTGATATVGFAGDRELTATVAVSAITRLHPAGHVETVDPTDIHGRIDVHVVVDRGADTPEAVTVRLGGEVVGRQLFNLDDGAAAPGPAGSTFQLQFTVDTHAFDPSSGLPRFHNGAAQLLAVLDTREGGEDVWNATTPVTLRNRNTFAGRLHPESGPVSGDDGRLWVSGDLEVELLPVLYDEGIGLASAVVELRRVGGATLRERVVDGEGPFRTVFEGTGEPGFDNVAGYRTPDGSTDEFRVRTATFGDGSTLAAPVVIVPEVLVDNAQGSG